MKKTKDTMTLAEASKHLKVNISRIRALARQGKINRVRPGVYDKNSVLEWETSLLKYTDRKAKILQVVTDSWRKHRCSTTINKIADAVGISTSVTARYIVRMQKDKDIVVVEHKIYPKGLYDVIEKAIDEYLSQA